MLKMFAIVAHAQSHSGTKGKVIRNEDGSIAGFTKNGADTYTKKHLKKLGYYGGTSKGGNTGTGGKTKG